MDIKTIDMSHADGQAVTEFDLVRKQLREDSKYKKDLLYRGFNGKYIEKLLLTGQDTNGKYLFCYTEAEILEGTSEGDSDNSGPFEYVTDYKLGAIAVFDSKHLKNILHMHMNLKILIKN